MARPEPRVPVRKEDWMKSLLTSAAWIGLTVSMAGLPLNAQLQDNTEKQMTCQNGGSDGDTARHCEIREQTLPAAGSLNIDAGQNGGVSVKGWLQSQILVRARVETSGDTAAAAASMASQVTIDSSGGQVRAIGPEAANNSWWSVSYEIFVPQNSDLTLKAHNGGLTVSDVRGQIHFDADQRRRAPETGRRRCQRRDRERRHSGGVDRNHMGWAPNGSQHPQRRRYRRHAILLLGPHTGGDQERQGSVRFSDHDAG
jgi:hypothetical protein